MANTDRKKLLNILRFALGTILLGLLGCVYFMGIVCPSFDSPFQAIYRGIGYGLIYPLYFLLIPAYMNKYFPDIGHAGAIASIVSAILTVILLFITFPLQI